MGERWRSGGKRDEAVRRASGALDAPTTRRCAGAVPRRDASGDAPREDAMRRSRWYLAVLAVLAGGHPARAQAPGETEVKASVAPYTVSEGFREVVNYAAFKKAIPLPPAVETLLRRNLFACAPRGDK